MRIHGPIDKCRTLQPPAAGGSAKAGKPPVPPSFENRRIETEQALRALLGKNFFIEVTDEGVFRDPNLFDLWAEFTKEANIDGRLLESIILSAWDSEQLITPVRGEMVEVMDTAGGISDEGKWILLNTSWPKCRLVAFHEFSELVLKQFGRLLVFTDLEEKEYVVNLIAYTILQGLNQPTALEYKCQFVDRHVLIGPAMALAQRTADKVVLEMRLSHYRVKLGKLPELDIAEDSLPVAALRDMPPQKRPPDYFKKGDFILIDLRHTKKEMAPDADVVKAAVTNVDRQEAQIDVEIVSDDGELQSLCTGFPVRSPEVYKWSASTSPFIPGGGALRPKRYVIELRLPEALNQKLSSVGIVELEMLRQIPRGLLAMIPNIDAADIAAIEKALKPN